MKVRSLLGLSIAFPSIFGEAQEETCLDPGACSVVDGNDATVPPEQQRRDTSKTSACSLYLAKSNYGGLGMYAGVDFAAGEAVSEPDILIPVTDANKQHWSHWQDFSWNGGMFSDALLENSFFNDVLAPGIGSHAKCHENFNNMDRLPTSDANDSAGVNRTSDPTAGSFSYRHNNTYAGKRTIKAGEEILIECGGISDGKKRPEATSPDSLQENGLCMDGLRPGISTIPGAGRGAFSTRFVPSGAVLTHSPLIHMDRKDMDIVEQYFDEDEDEIVYEYRKKKGTQLMLNYCFGNKESNVLLLPSGPVVNLINHNGQSPSVAIRWSSSALQPSKLFEISGGEFLSGEDNFFANLLIEYVALRDIEDGEEIFLDYGEDWQDAWTKHVEGWAALAKEDDYAYPADFNAFHEREDLRTVREQQSNPYPSNLQTVCRFMQTDDDEDDGSGKILWTKENDGCLRPCDIQTKHLSTEPSQETLYVAVMHQIGSASVSEDCELYDDNIVVRDIPRGKIAWADKAYHSDLHIKGAFRHAIGLPSDLLPTAWRRDFVVAEALETETISRKSFLSTPLEPYQMSPLVLGDSGEVAAQYAFRIGLPETVTTELQKYCDRLGITKAYQSLVIDGIPLPPGIDERTKFKGQNWLIQRPAKKWKSNMHWISPVDEESQTGYLQALSAGGFDKVLDAIGNYLGLDGLVCFQLTFIGVSYSEKSYIHYDFHETGGKAFNVIIPLMLANDSEPELDVQADDGSFIAGYRYRIGEASMVGDNADHGTAAVDYRDTGEMRMAATVYIADVNPDNVDSILSDYTQEYPPKDPDLLLSKAGSHWKAGDPSKRLPAFEGPVGAPEAEESEVEPTGRRLFVSTPLEPYQISPLTLADTGEVAAEYAFRIGLPETVTAELQKYCDRLGITKAYQSLVIDDQALPPGTDEHTKFGGQNWLIQRPDNWWKSNMHWISPVDEESQTGYLQALSAGGFDKVLDAIGNYLGLDGLVCYQLTFIGVTHSEKSYLHNDFHETGGKAFNVIIPLMLANDTEPELDIQAEDESFVAGYRYRIGEASMVGDFAHHGTAAADYRGTGEMRMAATVYIADVNADNVASIMNDYTQEYPPKDPDLLLSKAGSHWKAGDPSKRLPAFEGSVGASEAEESEVEPTGQRSFVSTPLEPYQISPLILAETGEVAAEYAFRIGLPDSITAELQAYCDRLGITKVFQSLVIDDQELPPGTDEHTKFKGQNWLIQRPAKKWKSNMHWISPVDEESQTGYLQALSAGGFDKVLDANGNYLGLDGLVCYQLTFIGVSYSEKSYIHYDFKKTGGRAFNVIIPMILANVTEPELEVRADDKSFTAGYRYRIGEASMLGDHAYHGTAAADYRDTGEMRMAATVYIADVNPDNVESVMNDYTQEYPPKDSELLLSKAGSHWKAGDPSKRLPAFEGLHTEKLKQ